RRLADLSDRVASDPRLSATAAPAHRTVPRLNVRGPLALGLIAILLFIAAGLGAAFTRLGDLAALAGGALFETRLTPVALRNGCWRASPLPRRSWPGARCARRYRAAWWRSACMGPMRRSRRGPRWSRSPRPMERCWNGC